MTILEFRGIKSGKLFDETIFRIQTSLKYSSRSTMSQEGLKSRDRDI